MRLTLIVLARMARLRRERRCSRVTAGDPSSVCSASAPSVAVLPSTCTSTCVVRVVLRVHARLLPAHPPTHQSPSGRCAGRLVPTPNHSILARSFASSPGSARDQRPREPAPVARKTPAAAEMRGDNRRTITRADCTLNDAKDRGQSIVRLFFVRFHYGTCFAWLDRGRDSLCHCVRSARRSDEAREAQRAELACAERRERTQRVLGGRRSERAGARAQQAVDGARPGRARATRRRAASGTRRLSSTERSSLAPRAGPQGRSPASSS